MNWDRDYTTLILKLKPILISRRYFTSLNLICLFRNSVPIRGFNYTVFERMVKSLNSRLLLLYNLRRGVGCFHSLYAEPVSGRCGQLWTAVGLWWAVSCRCRYRCRTDGEPWRRRRGRAFARADREPYQEHVYTHLSFDWFVLLTVCERHLLKRLFNLEHTCRIVLMALKVPLRMMRVNDWTRMVWGWIWAWWGCQHHRTIARSLTGR